MTVAALTLGALVCWLWGHDYRYAHIHRHCTCPRRGTTYCPRCYQWVSL